jgi:WD repeat-containing protein 61
MQGAVLTEGGWLDWKMEIGTISSIIDWEVADEKEIPAFACALHPSNSAWAYCGRSSKIVIRPISSDAIESLGTQNGDEEDGGTSKTGKGPLGGEGQVADTGKGKFAMDLQFVG